MVAFKILDESVIARELFLAFLILIYLTVTPFLLSPQQTLDVFLLLPFIMLYCLHINRHVYENLPELYKGPLYCPIMIAPYCEVAPPHLCNSVSEKT